MAGSVAELALQPATHATLVRRVKLLSWLSLAWMTAEGAIGVTAGILANSIALIGYGLDSTIEGIASVVVIWRFTGQRVHSDEADRQRARVERDCRRRSAEHPLRLPLAGNSGRARGERTCRLVVGRPACRS